MWCSAHRSAVGLTSLCADIPEKTCKQMYCCTFTDVQLVCSWEKSLVLVNCSVLNKAQIHQEILSQLSLWLLLPAQFNGQKPGIFVKLTDFSHPLRTSPWKLSFLGSNFLWCNPAVWPDNHLEKCALLMCLGLELNSCKKEKNFPSAFVPDRKKPT